MTARARKIAAILVLIKRDVRIGTAAGLSLRLVVSLGAFSSSRAKISW